MKFILLLSFICLGSAANLEVKALHITTLEVLQLTVKQENEIIDEFYSIHQHNPSNKIRAEKLATYLNQSQYCTETNNDGWNVIALDDSWYDRHVFYITSKNVHYLAMKVGGFGIKEQIFVVFNEC